MLERLPLPIPAENASTLIAVIEYRYVPEVLKWVFQSFDEDTDQQFLTTLQVERILFQEYDYDRRAALSLHAEAIYTINDKLRELASQAPRWDYQQVKDYYYPAQKW